MPEILTAEEAAQLIKDDDTIASVHLDWQGGLRKWPVPLRQGSCRQAIQEISG